ncbi:hypothetical protein BVRB_4g093850 [Beta vulgaris subsp. vulgaris]|nr:hypothetical protein BVRB_4g093850 [Beta vulgaris subsp. vulgaris]
MAGQWVTTQEVIDELNRVKAEMATLKESYVASCMEIQSLKSAKKTSKGPKPRNVRGVSRMQNLDGEGFETPENRADLGDADDSEKEDADDGENDGADPPKEFAQGRLDDPIQQRLQQLEDMIARVEQLSTKLKPKVQHCIHCICRTPLSLSLSLFPPKKETSLTNCPAFASTSSSKT